MYIKLKLVNLQSAGAQNGGPDAFECPDLIYDNLDGLVNLNSKSWFTTVDNFKERKLSFIQGSVYNLNLNFNSQYLLEFLGSWRKLIIEFGIKAVIDKLIDRYPGLNNSKLEEIIISDAYGSTNITSDYDLTLSGPGTYLIVKCILDKWKSYDLNLIVNKTSLTRTTPKTFRDTFDSNFYLAPDLVLNTHMVTFLTDKHNIKLYKVKKINNNWSKYTIIPHEEHYELEIQALNKKLNSKSIDEQINDYNNTNKRIGGNNSRDDYTKHSDSHPVSLKYDKLITLGEKLDDFLYKNEEKISQNKNELIKHVMDMLENSIEGYYCLSTIIAVVYGIQAKKLDDIKTYFNDYKKGWVIAAIENLIDLFKHLKDHNKLIDSNIILKVSKYIYRIYFCLNYYFDGKNVKVANRMNIAKKLVDKRGSRKDQAMTEINSLLEIIKLPEGFDWNKYKQVFIDEFIPDISSRITIAS